MRILLALSQTEGDEELAFAATIADELIARGHEVFILSDTRHTPTRATHVPFPFGQHSFWGALTHITRLLRLIRRHRIQVVHVHSRAADWESRFATRLAGAAWLQKNTLDDRLASKSGELSFGGPQFDRGFARTEPGDVVQTDRPPAALVERVRRTSTLDSFVDRLEQVYRSVYVKFYRREIPILCYHRLVESEAECGKFDTHIRVGLIEQHLRYLRDHGYRTLHFADLNSARVFERAQRAVILTFDDGYEDNYRLLLPLLKKYNAKAVVYLVSGRQTNEWDVAKGERSLRLMNQSQRREMLASGLVEFGAHTRTHPDLTEISPEQAGEEIHLSKMELEVGLGVEVHTFAYPYGHLNHHVKESVRQAGFRYGVALHSGPLAVHEDPLHVRRIVVFPNTTMRRFRRKVSGGYARLSSSRSSRKS